MWFTHSNMNGDFCYMAKKKKGAFVAPELLNFLDVLELLEKTPKTNDKIAIIEKNKDIPHLKEYLILALDDRITFNINKIEENKGTKTAFSRMGLSTWDNFKLVINALIQQDVSGHAANDAVESFLRNCNNLEKKWYLRCIQKDIASTKVGRKIMDDMWPGSVLYWRCFLAEQEDKIDKILEADQNSFIWGYAYLELKKNGIRTFFENYNNNIQTPVGRSGLPIENFEFLGKFIEKLGLSNMMLDGECSVRDCLEDTMTVFNFDFSKTEKDFLGKSGKIRQKAWEKYQDSYARADALRKNLKFTIFAAIPRNEWYNRSPKWTYEEMREYLTNTVKPLIQKYGLEDYIEVIDSIKVNNYAHARKIADRYISFGAEGGIIKSPHHVYQFKRTRDWVKLKEEVEIDYQIIGYEIQKDKYNGDGTLKLPMVGKFLIRDQAGREYKIGTGKSWDEKFYIYALNNYEKEFHNKIGKLTAQRFTDKAAICPRHDCWRPDKTSLED